MCDREHNRSSGRTRPVVMAVLVIVIGIGMMLYPKMTDLRYAWAQWSLAADVAGQTGTAGEHPGLAREDGVTLPEGVVAVLEIPSLDFHAYVLEGAARSVLARGPGHLPGTPLPGEGGNSAIAGHRTMHGHPFNHLDLIQPGDRILTGTAACTAVYQVIEVRIVHPDDTEVIAQTGVDRLTLITCHPKGSATRRLIVVAEPTG